MNQTWLDERPARSRHTDEIIAHAAAGGPSGIERRLAELDDETSVEQMLGMTGSLLVLLGLVLGATHTRKWWLLSAGATALLLQPSLAGPHGPRPFLRGLGLRTAREIVEERMALKALRGDFKDLPAFTHGQDQEAARRLLDVVRR